MSLLSMMAAYEVGKNSEDIRNSVVHSLQAGQTAPNKSGGDDADEVFVLKVGDPEFWKPSPRFERAPDDQIHLAYVPRSFNARAPPALRLGRSADRPAPPALSAAARGEMRLRRR